MLVTCERLGDFFLFGLAVPTNQNQYDKPSIRDGVLCSGILLYLHHRNSKLFFHPAKFDNFKDEKIPDFKTELAVLFSW